MKKLLGIVVLGLLWCNISFADNKILYCTLTAHDKFNENENFEKNIEPRTFKITISEKWITYYNEQIEFLSLETVPGLFFG